MAPDAESSDRTAGPLEGNGSVTQLWQETGKGA